MVLLTTDGEKLSAALAAPKKELNRIIAKNRKAEVTPVDLVQSLFRIKAIASCVAARTPLLARRARPHDQSC